MIKIGITISVESKNGREDYSIPADYLTAVIKSGASPVLIPPIEEHSKLEEYLESIDGLLLTGGDDISPELYGEKNTGLSRHISMRRDEAELYIIGRAVHFGLPVLGICRGFQILNAYFGGSLFQDIGSQFNGVINHANSFNNATDLHHEVFFEYGTTLMKISGVPDMIVNSRHHQGIKTLGTELKPAAYAGDGLVEAFENMEMNIIAVQWHPENIARLGGKYTALFDDLVKRAGLFADNM